MIQTDFRYAASFKQSDSFVWPIDPDPSFWGHPFIIEIDTHSRESDGSDAKRQRLQT